MTTTTQDRVDRIVRAVFAYAGSEICRHCIIAAVHDRAREQGLRISYSNAKARVRALWNEPRSAADDATPIN